MAKNRNKPEAPKAAEEQVAQQGAQEGQDTQPEQAVELTHVLIDVQIGEGNESLLLAKGEVVEVLRGQDTLSVAAEEVQVGDVVAVGNASATVVVVQEVSQPIGQAEEIEAAVQAAEGSDSDAKAVEGEVLESTTDEANVVKQLEEGGEAPTDAPAPEDKVAEGEDLQKAAEEATVPTSGDEPEAPTASDEVQVSEGDETEQEVVAEESAPVHSLRVSLKNILTDDALAAWPDEALELYDQKGVMQPRTARGSWEVDIRRTSDVGAWPHNALLDWMEDKIKTPEGLDDELVWDNIRLRYKCPGNWPNEAVRDFALNGVRPEVTVDGLLVNDPVRDVKALDQWTYLELRSALLELITSPFSNEEMIGAIKVLLNLPESHSDNHILESLTQTPTESNVNNTILKSKLDEYRSFMTKYGANLTEASAGKAQVMLYNTIRKVMQREPAEFIEGWNIVLDFIDQNYTVLFTPNVARRGWSSMNMASGAMATFEDLLTLMIATRKPAERKSGARLFKLDNILRHVHAERDRQNLFAYYAE